MNQHAFERYVIGLELSEIMLEVAHMLRSVSQLHPFVSSHNDFFSVKNLYTEMICNKM
jgi:hypothetical protein